MALARARPEDRDATLLRAATALFCQEPHHDRDAVRRFEQLAIHLLPKMGDSDRAYVASLLGGRQDAPASVMRLLARDAIGIAGPVLRHSPVLATVDLLGVIASTGAEHHRLITTRPDLNADVLRALAIARKRTDAILHTEEVEPEHADETQPRDAEPIQEMSAAGPDVPSRHLHGLNLGEFLEATTERRLKMLGEASSRGLRSRTARSNRRLDTLLRQTFAAAEVVAAARRGDRSALLKGFSTALGIGTDIAARLLDDPSGEPLVLMAKAAGLNGADGRTVLLLANKEIGESVDKFFRLADLYASLEPTTADAFMDAWRTSPAPTRATHVPVFAENADRIARADQPAREDRRETERRAKAS